MERRFTYRTPQEALDAITKFLPFLRLDSERIEVGNAYGRILDQDLVAPVNLPSHDMSHFDGYAVRAEDTNDASVQNPVYFTVIGELYPGQSPNYEVHEGEAVYVTTGSFLPKGANAIVAVEATKRINARARSQIEVRSAVDLHEHVIDCGSDIQQGVTLFREGHKLRAQDISMLASLGVEQLSVVKQPAVAIICVGDELTDVVHESEPGEDREGQGVGACPHL